MRHLLFRSWLILLVLAGGGSAPVTAQERDPLAPIEEMEAPQFEAFPPDIIAQENAEAIIALVNEARLFGVPLAVRVVSLPTDVDHLSGFDDLDLSSPIPMETMHEMAQAWMESEPIESSPGAGDGFLMLVVMPPDPTLSSAVIEAGPNALPLNGLTQENINEVINELVMPLFAENKISQGIRLGLSVFSYNNLFGEPERLELDELHQDLRLFGAVPLAGLTVLGSLALVGLAFWIHRREHAANAEETGRALSPFGAAALEQGRVNDAVVTGALLHLIRLGVLIPGDPGDLSLRLTPQHAGIRQPFARTILDILRRHADRDGNIQDAATRRIHDLLGPARSQLEDDLARHGYFNKDGKAEFVWLVLGSLLVATIGLFTLLPSMLGMARAGIFSIVFAALCITGVLIWASRRSWTTHRGERALAVWLEDASIEERATFDTIINQDVLISAQGGPIVPNTINLVRSLRGIGAT